MGELSWVVSPATAPIPRTGGWRTGVKPEIDMSKCIDCLLCWLWCPDSAIELDGVAVTCVPATRLAAERGSGFANIVMLGAVAAALGEPPLAALEDAAAEQLGRKASPDDVRAAVRKGYACLS